MSQTHIIFGFNGRCTPRVRVFAYPPLEIWAPNFLILLV